MYESRVAADADERVAAAVAGLSGADLAVALTGVLSEVGRLSPFGKVEAISGFEQVVRWAHAQKLALLGDLGDERGVHDTEQALLLGAEVSLALGVGRHTADALVADAFAMRTRVPMVLEALEQGRVCERAAAVIVAETAALDAPAAARVAAAVLARADLRTVPRVRALTRAAVLRADPATAHQREARAARGRFVRADHRIEDGMVGWSAWLPAADSVRMWDRLRSLADASKVPGDHREPEARRADVFCDLVLSRPVSTVDGEVVDTVNPAGRPVWRTDLVVEASTLQGADEDPGQVTSWGPVTAAIARRLAAGHTGAVDRPLSPPGAPDADAQWRRILTDPVSGMVTDYGTIRYRPPDALADLIRARDGRCFEPSCTVTAWRSDLDHLRPSPAGPSPAPNADGATSAGNLAAACRRHHRTKQAPGWAVRADPASESGAESGPESAQGALTWTTPTGHTYTRHPEPPLPWHRHPALDPPAARPVLHHTHPLPEAAQAVTDDSCRTDSRLDEIHVDDWPMPASVVEATIENLLRSIQFEYADASVVGGPSGEPDAEPPPPS
ncbi:MAG TPA: DUF222 domain-containing protein [Actinomycetales bacterium]